MPQVTPKVVLIEHTPNPELVIATSAKLCYSDLSIEEITKKNMSADTNKFIDKIVLLGHLSPIEHASFTFGIEGVSRSLLAQITRHRIASFSVKSQRYVSASKANADSFNYVVPPQILALGETAVTEYENQMKTMFEWYKDWQDKLGGHIESSNEDARFVLPNAMETKMIVTMNARELLHFFSLRCCNRAQWEIREVAWQMLKLCLEKAPHLFAKAGASCIGGACIEGAMSCGKAQEVRERQKTLINN